MIIKLFLVHLKVEPTPLPLQIGPRAALPCDCWQKTVVLYYHSGTSDTVAGEIS